ncbi:MAG: DUF1566 domain-containing protein [bacterium]|nr:DUF1566 domain-containing protein [bacterium]
MLSVGCAKSNFVAAETNPGTEVPEANGSSSTYPVVDTGQDSCYDDSGGVISPPGTGERFCGQDAQYNGLQMASRNNGDGTVSDLNTDLMWQKTPDFNNLMTWEEAKTYAENLTLGGHDDWRLPTIKELYSIVSFNGSMRTQTPYIDTGYFDFQYPDTSTGLRDMDAQYWSSTRYTGTTMYGDESAFGFNFADGRIKSYPIYQGPGGTPMARYVRCVRGNTSYGVNDFEDNGDGTVTDHATGLTWMKADSGTGMNWEEALEYSENLVYAGHDDWRLPNAKELQSIVDYTRAPDASDPAFRSAAIDPVFELTDTESYFWTGTSHGDNLAFGIYVCFGRGLSALLWNGEAVNAHGAGAQRSDPKSGNPADWPNGLGPQSDDIRITNYVRCVRGQSE